MTRRLLALVVLCLPGFAAAAPPAHNPFAVEVQERLERVGREAGRPEAVVALLGILDPWERSRPADLWDSVPPEAIEALLRQAAGPRSHPLVRARAEYLLAVAADRRGDWAEAARRRAAVGLITDWLVAGPFDNEGRGGYGVAAPPESQTSGPVPMRARYAGKERRPVGWRAYPPLSSAGFILLDPVVKPDANACAYAQTFVESPEAHEAAVRVGSNGAIKVWVNGALAVGRDVYRPARFDQNAGFACLRRGWNRVLVKSCTTSGRWGFFLRVTDPAGRPLPGLRASAEPGLGAPAGPAPAGAAREVADLGALLRARAERAPRDVQAQRDLALYLLFVAPDDPAEQRPQAAAQRAVAARADAESLRVLALCSADPNDRRRALERALRALPADPPPGPARRLRARLLGLLGDAYADAHRERRAARLWNDALRADPDYFPATIRLALLAADRGLGAYAERSLSELALRFPGVAVVARERAALLARRGRRADAQALWRALLPTHADDLEPLRELFDAARVHGRYDEALALMGRMQRARPEVVSLYFDRAAVLEVSGRLDEAARMLQDALRLMPDDVRLLERLGKLLMRLGRKDDALRFLRRVLELTPQNAALRDYLAAQDPARDSSLARTWARDPRPLLAEGRARSFGAAGRRPGAAALLDLEVTQVHENGLSETFAQRLVLVLDERGAREQAERLITYTPDTQSVEVRVARVHRADGSVVEAASREDRDLSDPSYGEYYDYRGYVVRMPTLKPGDVVEVQHVLSDVGRRNLFADYFGTVHFFAEEIPRVHSELVLVTPRARSFYFNTPRLAGLKREEKVSGDLRIYRFQADDVPRVELEVGMPGWSEAAPYVHVSTYRTWSELGAWYDGLVREQFVLDDEIRAAVRQATRGITDERARVAAIHDFVVKKTRYVALEFGIHGYKPYRTTQVFARKFGDCKDKASLLVVMLRAIGVKAHLVLLRTRRAGDIDDLPPSIAIFDHAIVWVPKYDLFLDGTAEFSGTRELPGQDQGVPVLIILDGDGRFMRTKVLPARENRVTRRLTVRLAPDGGARLEENVTVAGQAAQEWRSHYQSPGQRRERYEKAMNAAFPGARVLSVAMPHLADLERSVEVQGVATAPTVARSEAGGRVVRAGGRESELSRAYARLSERRWDLILGYPWEQDEEVVYELPAGWTAPELPPRRELTAPFGRFQLTAAREGSTVRVRFQLRIDRYRFARADYPAFRRFLVEVDAALNQGIVLKP
jgi:tetratricopeptide (TPR) repeat protein/transglutaminase-like putative cysteine protease